MGREISFFLFALQFKKFSKLKHEHVGHSTVLREMGNSILNQGTDYCQIFAKTYGFQDITNIENNEKAMDFNRYL